MFSAHDAIGLVEQAGGEGHHGPLHRRRPGRPAGLAGMLGLRYRVFVLWTGATATLWAAAHVLLGYAVGAGWRHIHQLTGRVGMLLALAVAVGLAVTWLVRRPARRHQDEPGQPVAVGRRRD